MASAAQFLGIARGAYEVTTAVIPFVDPGANDEAKRCAAGAAGDEPGQRRDADPLHRERPRDRGEAQTTGDAREETDRDGEEDR